MIREPDQEVIGEIHRDQQLAGSGPLKSHWNIRDRVPTEVEDFNSRKLEELRRNSRQVVIRQLDVDQPSEVLDEGRNFRDLILTAV